MIAGTNGEAATLTSGEKSQLVQTTRKVAQRLGRGEIPIVLGCGAGCTRDVIDQTVEAKAAGADAALVLVPSYFHFAMDAAAITSFFQEVADSSPIPIIIYNFPGVVAGLDVNSEMLDILGRHKNIVGVKLTCGGIGKVPRVAAAFKTSEFCALAGQSDWLIPALSAGGTGCITGVANLFPKVSTWHCHLVATAAFADIRLRPAFSYTISTNRARPKKPRSYRNNCPLLNGDLESQESTVQSGWLLRISATLKPVRIVADHIQYMGVRRRRSGY